MVRTARVAATTPAVSFGIAVIFSAGLIAAVRPLPAQVPLPPHLRQAPVDSADGLLVSAEIALASHRHRLQAPGPGSAHTAVTGSIELFLRADSLFARSRGCPALTVGWGYALAVQLAFHAALDGCSTWRMARRAAALRGGGESHILAGDSAAAMTALRKAIRAASAPRLPVAAARSHLLLGIAHRLFDRPDSALFHFDWARAVLEEAELRYVRRDPAMVEELEQWSSWREEVMDRVLRAASGAGVNRSDALDPDALVRYALDRARFGSPIPIPDPPGGRSDASLDRLRVLRGSVEFGWGYGGDVLHLRLSAMRHLSALHRAEGREPEAFRLARAIQGELEKQAEAVDLVAEDLEFARETGAISEEAGEATVEMSLAARLGRSFENEWGHFACLPAAGLPPCVDGPADDVVELERGIIRDRWLGDFDAELTALERLRGRYTALGRADSAAIYEERAQPVVAGLARAPAGRARGATEAPRAQRLALARAAGALWDSLSSYWEHYGDDRELYEDARARLDTLARALDAGIDLDAEDPATRSVAELRLLIAAARAHRRAGAIDDALHYFEEAWERVPIGGPMGHPDTKFSDETNLAVAEQTADLYGEWALTWLAWGRARGSARADTLALLAVECGRARTLVELGGATGPVGCEWLLAQAARNDWLRLPASPAAHSSPFGRSNPQGILVHEPTADTLLIWFHHPGGLDVERVPVSRDSLARWVRTVRAGVAAGATSANSLRSLEPPTRGFELTQSVGAEDFDRARLRLSEALFPPSIAGLLPEAGERMEIPVGYGEDVAGVEVVVSPGGVLNELPYAVLTPGGASEPLGLRIALRFTPSISIRTGFEGAGAGSSPDYWDILIRGDSAQSAALPSREEWLGRSVVAGAPILPTRLPWAGAVDFPSLPGAAAEAERIAARLGVVPLKGAEATEAALRAKLEDASIVHLATHGFAYSAPQLVVRSFVGLAEGSGHDGFLTVGELVAEEELSLSSVDLVVLSACQTGLGRTTQAEGTVGLQRALLGRGARSLLVSLWNVSDAATALLMDRFYEEWLTELSMALAADGRRYELRSWPPGKAEALRRAMAAVRATPGFEHPRYWAAFQLVGAN